MSSSICSAEIHTRQEEGSSRLRARSVAFICVRGSGGSSRARQRGCCARRRCAAIALGQQPWKREQRRSAHRRAEPKRRRRAERVPKTPKHAVGADRGERHDGVEDAKRGAAQVARREAHHDRQQRALDYAHVHAHEQQRREDCPRVRARRKQHQVARHERRHAHTKCNARAILVVQPAQGVGRAKRDKREAGDDERRLGLAKSDLNRARLQQRLADVAHAVERHHQQHAPRLADTGAAAAPSAADVDAGELATVAAPPAGRSAAVAAAAELDKCGAASERERRRHGEDELVVVAGGLHEEEDADGADKRAPLAHRLRKTKARRARRVGGEVRDHRVTWRRLHAVGQPVDRL
eukprot:364542-Chlamydomonas_euryale.AAC.2